MLLLNLPDSYPMKLQPMLSGRYTDQSVEVINAGCAGEFVDDDSMHCPGGVQRLPGVLDRDRPQVLLLMHGANDLLQFEDAAIPGIVGALEQMIGEAQRRNIVVLLATLPPQNPAGSRGAGADELPALNREIVKMAADEGATFVDLLMPRSAPFRATSAPTASTRRRPATRGSRKCGASGGSLRRGGEWTWEHVTQGNVAGNESPQARPHFSALTRSYALALYAPTLPHVRSVPADVRIAFRTSADCGRISSSRSGA